eukprot:CAMPEP_0183336354 /NCGR_PEP_ID=MMETSP0164_2-20130417/4357_1 /TAXON_ID=221442 /ORGANISM="Coccolithus pelagicus ssp braarudi, Strain PLY182g" /LENGTH=87 /DNA_ID=CAMNT_0025505855 /DNA_START=133 /DNA_END=396 /DNA_ORIENTATION=+
MWLMSRKGANDTSCKRGSGHRQGAQAICILLITLSIGLNDLQQRASPPRAAEAILPECARPYHAPKEVADQQHASERVKRINAEQPK